MNRVLAHLRSREGLVTLAMLALLGLALGLRLNGVTWGLPYNFLNPDEGTIVPKAFHVAQGHLNPQFFFYPSLFFYLLAAVYWLVTPAVWLIGQTNFLAESSYVLDPGPYFLLGRLLAVVFGVAAVYLVYRLGRLAFSPWVGLLAAAFLAVEPLHVKYSHVAVTDVPATTLALLALLLLLGAAQGRGRRWLLAGAVAAGMATATKYNLGMLVLPATVAAVFACRDDAASRVAAGGRAALAWARLWLARIALPMALGFVLASPYVLIDLPHFVRDFRRQNAIMQTGWLGFENVDNGFWYNVNVNLAGALGLVLLVVALAGLAFALWRRTRFDLMVAPYVVVYFLYISTWKELADRYLLPIVPLLLLLAARLCIAALRTRRVARPALAAGTAALVAAALFVPLTDSIAFNRQLSGTDVRVRAKQWVESSIPSGSVIAVDTYGPPLVRRRETPIYREAGEDPVAYWMRVLKLPVPGKPDLRHRLKWLRGQDVQYVIVSSTNYDRVFAAADRYPKLAAFYRRLDRAGTLIRVFRPGDGERGPVLKVYRLEARAASR